MLLKAKHNSRKYTRLRLGKKTKPRSHSKLFRLLGGEFVHPLETGRLWSLGDSEEMTLNEFATHYLELRDDLAFRKLNGEQLTPRELLVLATLNRQLELLLPMPSALPRDVKDVVKELLSEPD